MKQQEVYTSACFKLYVSIQHTGRQNILDRTIAKYSRTAINFFMNGYLLASLQNIWNLSYFQIIY